jgi:hypothetical protein
MQIDLRHEAGHIAELYAAYYLANKGFNVLWPLKTQIKYDLAIEKEGKIYKIQVKKATWSKSGPYEYLQSRTSKGHKGGGFHYEKTDVDYFLFTDNKTVWFVPYEEINGMTSVCLGSTNPKYSPSTKYNATKWII